MDRQTDKTDGEIDRLIIRMDGLTDTDGEIGRQMDVYRYGQMIKQTNKWTDGQKYR